MREHAVIIAGGGPTGMMLAAELALAKVDVAIVERRPDHDLAGSRAGGLHPRALEELDQRGIVDRFVVLGKKRPVVLFPGAILDKSDLPSRYAYSLGIWQTQIERILADWIDELGVKVYRRCEVTGFAVDESGVAVSLKDGRTLRAQYLAGCDGGRSLVRKHAGIDFPGWAPSLSYLIVECDMVEEPKQGVQHGERGVQALGRLEDGRIRGVITEQSLKQGDEPTLDELREALVLAYGSDYGVHNVTWLSRFTDAARQAASYRKGRVLLAGDSAHVHSPTGGQGLNIGLQDAMNLGWKLAQVVKGISPQGLLDTYHAERHPIGAAVIRHTLAMTALSRGDERTNALREILPQVMRMDGPRKWYGAMMGGLDIRYDVGGDHQLAGRRMPDLEISTPNGPQRVFTLLHKAQPVLLAFGKPGAIDIAPYGDRVQRVDARYDGPWELPVIGEVAPPSAVLVRPDGYVAWVGVGDTVGLMEAMTRWFGPPSSA